MTSRVGQIGFGPILGLLDELLGYQVCHIDSMNDGNPVLMFTTAMDIRGFTIPVASVIGGSRTPYNWTKVASGQSGHNSSELWIGTGGRGTAHDFTVTWNGWNQHTLFSTLVMEIGGVTTGVIESSTVATGTDALTSSPVTPTQTGDTVAIFFGWDGGIGFWPGLPWGWFAPNFYPYNRFPNFWFNDSFQQAFHQIGTAGTAYSATLSAPHLLGWELGWGFPFGYYGLSGGLVAIACVVKAQIWPPVITIV